MMNFVIISLRIANVELNYRWAAVNQILNDVGITYRWLSSVYVIYTCGNQMLKGQFYITVYSDWQRPSPTVRPRRKWLVWNCMEYSHSLRPVGDSIFMESVSVSESDSASVIESLDVLQFLRDLPVCTCTVTLQQSQLWQPCRRAPVWNIPDKQPSYLKLVLILYLN